MKRNVALLLLVLALAACGNKGPLVMPDPAPADAVSPMVAPAVEQPPEPVPPEPAPAEPVPGTSGTPAR